MSEQAAPAEELNKDESAAHGGETSTAVADPADEALFEDHELSQFGEDDTEAGRAICKMLSLFFLYTVIAMAIVGAWTFSSAFGM